MKRFTRTKLLALAVGVGITAVILMVGGLSTATATGTVDLDLEMEAPAHVAIDSVYLVRIAYYNRGTAIPPDAWVTATLPEGTQFITATDRWDDPLPPDAVDGNVLNWYFDNLACKMPLDANCGHILITLQTDVDLPDGTVLTTESFISTTAEETDTTNNETSVVSLIGAMAGSTKQVSARYARPGDVLIYTITLDHSHQSGGSNWQDVTLTDTLPFSHQVRFLGWQGPVAGTYDGHMLRWQGRVYAGEPITFQYRLGILGVVTPGTVISNVAAITWDGKQMRLGPITTMVTLPHGTMALEPFQGGQLVHQHGVTLTVPPGTVTDTTQFRLGPLFTNTHPITPPGGLLFANRAFELNAFRFGEPVHEFSRSLTITMNYTDTDFAGLKPQTLRVWTRSGPNGPWAMLGEPAKVMSGALSFTTTHLSQFALFAEGTVDLDLEMEAPAHVAIDSAYLVRIAYYNRGTLIPPDAWITATLPEGTQFVSAKDRWGDPLPPDTVDGNVLSWYFDSLSCKMPLDANCGHILITLQTDEDLPDGTVLTTESSITTTAEESDTTNNEESAISLIGAMAGSTKQVSARHARPGDVMIYTITLDHSHQSGGSNWQDVTLTDTLPFSHQVRFLGWQGSVTGTHDGHMLRWQGRVYAGEPITFQYRLGVRGVVTPGTTISNVAILAWDGKQMQLGPVATMVTLPHGTMALGPFQGGRLVHQHGVTLTVPPGTVTDTTQFRLGPLFTSTHPITPPGGLLFANRAFELNAFRFGEPVREFSRPLTITMNYTDTDVAGLKRETLRLWTRSGSSGPWVMLGEPVRVMSGTLAFTTMHLSQFALFAEPEIITGDVDLTLEMEAPAHVAIDSMYLVRIAYYNEGTAIPPDAWMTATLPEGTQFVTATDRWDDPLPPDTMNGNVLSWYFDSLSCKMPLAANCGHILITLQTDADLPDGTVLTTTASITTTAEESDTTNNQANIVSLIGAMAGSTKQVSARHARPGDLLTYTITLNHSHQGGGSNWQDVTLTDTLPFNHQARFLGWHGPVTGTHDGHMLRWQGRVQAGEPITFQYRLGVLGVVTPGTAIANVATLAWDGNQMRLGPITTVVTLPHGTMALERFQGGQLYHRHGVTLTVPPGTVTDTTQFRLGPLFTDTYPTEPPGGLLFANRAFELNAFRFGEPVREFSRPLTITMNYTDTDIAGLKRETLRLWTRTGPNGPWAMLGEPAQVMSGSVIFPTLTFTTTHLSQFALFGEAEHVVYLPIILR